MEASRVTYQSTGIQEGSSSSVGKCAGRKVICKISASALNVTGFFAGLVMISFCNQNSDNCNKGTNITAYVITAVTFSYLCVLAVKQLCFRGSNPESSQLIGDE